MLSGKSLGFFAGDKKLYLVEANGSSLVRSVAISLLSGDQEDETVASDIRLTGHVQKALRDERISASQIKFSIPTSETIIRSFVIPMMKPAELDAVVEFEIKKYIPFNLKDLAYDYQPLTITENNVRKMCIVFIAVRRAFLERYSHILEQAGLTVTASEPAPLSFVRTLVLKKIITAVQKIAVIQIEGAVGRLMFVHDGMVIFVREFPLSQPVVSEPGQEETDLKNRLINEVRNSLEFYNRQYASQPMGQMVVVASQGENYSQWLREDLSIEIKTVDPQSLSNNQPQEDQIGVLNAFGAAAFNEVKTKAAFDLSRKKGSRSSFLSGQPAFNIDLTEYMQAVKIAVGCAVVLVGVFVAVEMGLSGYQTTLEGLRGSQGQFADSSLEDVQVKIEREKAKLAQMKEIKVKSPTLEFFVFIPALLPQGVWLNTFEVRSIISGTPEKPGPSRWTMELEGTAYSEDPEQEIALVNEFVSKVRKDPRLTKYFTNINLASMERREDVSRITVSFRLSCN